MKKLLIVERNIFVPRSQKGDRDAWILPFYPVPPTPKHNVALVSIANTVFSVEPSVECWNRENS